MSIDETVDININKEAPIGQGSAIAITNCPACGSTDLTEGRRVSILGYIMIGVGATGVLLSLVLTVVYVGLLTLIPAILLTIGGAYIKEPYHHCEECGKEF